MMERLTQVGSASVLIGVLGAAHAAAAHAPPAVIGILSRKASDVVVATTRGIMFGELAAGHWSLLCSAAFGVTAGSQYQVTRVPSGRLLVGDHTGLRVSDDDGCWWRSHPALGALSISSIQPHPERSEHLYVAVHGEGIGGIRLSKDGGEAFHEIYRAPDHTRVDSVLVSAADPPHLYASLSRDVDWAHYAIVHSADGGTTWERAELVAAEAEVAVTLLAINPADPHEVFVRATNRELLDGDRLLRSTDSGRAFLEIGRFNGITGAAFSRDGRLMFVSTVDGLLRATSPSRVLEEAGDSAGLGHVAVQGSELVVGGYYATADAFVGGVAVGSVSDPLVVFTRFMTFEEVRVPKVCAAPSSVDRDCAMDWLDWRAEFIDGSSLATSAFHRRTVEIRQSTMSMP